MVVMAPSLGQTNFLAAGRILGTLTGAAAAVAFYSTFPDNPVALPLLGALVSVPCFYVIITRVTSPRRLVGKLNADEPDLTAPIRASVSIRPPHSQPHATLCLQPSRTRRRRQDHRVPACFRCGDRSRLVAVRLGLRLAGTSATRAQDRTLRVPTKLFTSLSLHRQPVQHSTEVARQSFAFHRDVSAAHQAPRHGGEGVYRDGDLAAGEFDQGESTVVDSAGGRLPRCRRFKDFSLRRLTSLASREAASPSPNIRSSSNLASPSSTCSPRFK